MVHRQVPVSLAGFTLVCVWTGLLFFQNNAGRFAWLNFPVQLVFVMALCGALWLAGICAAVAPALLPMRWSVARAFSVWTVGIFFLFSYEAIRYWLNDEFRLTGIPARMIYLFIVTGALVSAWRMSRHEPVRVAFVITAVLLTFLSLGSVMPIALARFGSLADTHKLALENGGSGRVLSKENVYYVILDGYGGPPALKKYLDHEIAPFLGQMIKLGYSYIDSARANYTVTHVSLAATLNMNYIVSDNSPRYRDRGDFFPGVLNRNQLPDIARRLQSARYHFIHVGNGWASCHSVGGVTCLSDINESTPFEDVSTRFLAPTRLIPAIERLLMTSNANEYDALTSLSRVIEDISMLKRPSFVFVHDLLPHEPLHADCSRSDAEMSKEEYKNSIKCVNHSVLSLAQRIQKVDPDAIVVFQGDHGSGFEANWKSPLAEWGDAAIDERSSILNLVHVPASCRKWVRPDLSPINTMRLVLGCLERRAPDYLAERTYLTAYETSPDFGVVREVTNLLPERREGLGLVGGKRIGSSVGFSSNYEPLTQ